MTPEEMVKALKDAGYTVNPPEAKDGMSVIAEWAEKNGYTFAPKDTKITSTESTPETGKDGGTNSVAEQLVALLGGGAAAVGTNGSGGKTPLTEDRILGMTPAEMNENWGAVREYIESNGGITA